MTSNIHKIRLMLVFFMITLFLSGVTAIPVAAELKWLLLCLPSRTPLTEFLQQVLRSYLHVQEQHHFLLYGYDWLAFAHFVLAILFIGPYKDPVRNIWVIEFGLIACVLVIPFALIAGYLRGLPIWWRLIDCSFGVIGFAVLWTIRRHIKELLSSTQNILSQTIKPTNYETVSPRA